jgi:hypothetical protein
MPVTDAAPTSTNDESPDRAFCYQIVFDSFNVHYGTAVAALLFSLLRSTYRYSYHIHTYVHNMYTRTYIHIQVHVG